MNVAHETKVEGNLAGLLTLAKQIRFAVAAAATMTGQQAQRFVIETIQRTFTTRSPWYEPGNRHGIHLKPATVADPSVELSTSAYWLVPHELGALKEATDGPFLAVPTEAVQPNERQLIPPNLRPRNLPGGFVLETSGGPKLFHRVNRRLRVAYHLVRQVQVKKQSTVIEPTVEIFDRNFNDNFGEKLQEAIKTAK